MKRKHSKEWKEKETKLLEKITLEIRREATKKHVQNILKQSVPEKQKGE